MGCCAVHKTMNLNVAQQHNTNCCNSKSHALKNISLPLTKIQSEAEQLFPFDIYQNKIQPDLNIYEGRG